MWSISLITVGWLEAVFILWKILISVQISNVYYFYFLINHIDYQIFFEKDKNTKHESVKSAFSVIVIILSHWKASHCITSSCNHRFRTAPQAPLWNCPRVGGLWFSQSCLFRILDKLIMTGESSCIDGRSKVYLFCLDMIFYVFVHWRPSRCIAPLKAVCCNNCVLNYL